MSIKSVMPSNYLILCHPLHFLPSIVPRIRSFPVGQFFASGGQSIGVSSFNISPSNEHSGLIAFGMDWFDLAVQGTLKSLQHHSLKASILQQCFPLIKQSSAAAAAAAKSHQSCPTLCDPIDGSPPGSAIPGILQARTLEWVAISFSNA